MRQKCVFRHAKLTLLLIQLTENVNLAAHWPQNIMRTTFKRSVFSTVLLLTLRTIRLTDALLTARHHPWCSDMKKQENVFKAAIIRSLRTVSIVHAWLPAQMDGSLSNQLNHVYKPAMIPTLLTIRLIDVLKSAHNLQITMATWKCVCCSVQMVSTETTRQENVLPHVQSNHWCSLITQQIHV